MQQTIEVPDYDTRRGLSLQWEPDASIRVRRSEAETLISGNGAGLVTLARHLLTVAQEAAPPGTHVHLDEFNGLEAGSAELILDLVE